MLFAISGSQGTGKTTLLNYLEDNYPNLESRIIRRKTSRSILADWGVTLAQVNGDPALTRKFQLEIVKRKADDEEAAVASPDVWFTERTYADLFTYAVVSLGKDNEHSAFLNTYFDVCSELQSSYSGVFYLIGGQFQVEHDGVRGSNQHYSTMVDAAMWAFTEQMTDVHNLTEIKNSCISRRADIIAHEVQYQTQGASNVFD